MSDLMNYEAIREADFIIIDKDIYEKLIPVEWDNLEEWIKNERK